GGDHTGADDIPGQLPVAEKIALRSLPVPPGDEKAKGDRDHHVDKKDGEVDGAEGDGVAHKALAVRRAGGVRPTASALRSGRPKPSKETAITSPSCSRTRSRKLKWSAPKK